MRDIHPSLERRDPRVPGAPDEDGQAGAHDRHRHHHRVRDREAHPREQVVDERVAEEPLEEREHQHQDPDVVDEVTRLAERAREEDAQQVEHDRDHEDVGRPVVGLADEQAGLVLERDVDDRAVGLAHLVALEGLVGPVVDGLRQARLEEEGEVHARRDEHDECVEGDLPEQERPVVGEQVAERLPQERRAAGALVEEAND